MSYIDTFDHEYLAHIGHLPIYHPLVAVSTGGADEDFDCGPDCLVLGGGAGEHPGLVMRRLECAVAHFLLEFVTDENESAIGKTAVEWLSDAACVPVAEVLRFHHWKVRQMAFLLEMARSPLHWAPLDDSMSVESWLLMSIGEFVYFSLPDLNPVPRQVLSAFEGVSIRPIMRNVVCLPPGYPLAGGRRIIDGQFVRPYGRWAAPRA